METDCVKQCRDCKAVKELDEFYLQARPRNNWQHYCKTCQKKRFAENYQRHKVERTTYKRERRRRLRAAGLQVTIIGHATPQAGEGGQS